MGVLNATPDSFSDAGQLSTPAQAVARARQLIEAGADVLDLGGESTRPGAETVSSDQELDRVLPILAALREAFPSCPISIDTYKPEVADVAIGNGADIVNDVWGLTHGMTADDLSSGRQAVLNENDFGFSPTASASAMAAVVARRNCPVVVMHNRRSRIYGDFWIDLLCDLSVSLGIARAAGVERHQIWLDPGFGFAKSVSQNLEVLRELNRICALGYPVLVGTSRKSTLGAVLGTKIDQRLEGGAATVVWAIQQGCKMVRVHDVREMARFVKMADAIKSGLNYSPAA